MCELDLVKNMIGKIHKLAVFDLNMNNPEDLKALNALSNMKKGTVLVVMPLAYTEQKKFQTEVDVDQGKHRTLPLTHREQDILALIAGGMTNKMIARELEISDGTVKVHVKNLMRKLKVRSRLEAAVWALGLGAEKSVSRSF